MPHVFAKGNLSFCCWVWSSTVHSTVCFSFVFFPPICRRKTSIKEFNKENVNKVIDHENSKEGVKGGEKKQRTDSTETKQRIAW